jgi:hypothetical protein
MTSRRFVLVAAALVVTAISLAFWLSSWAKAGSPVAGTSSLAKAHLGAPAGAISTARTPGFSSAVDVDDHAIGTGCTPAPPIVQSDSCRPWLPVSPGVSHSSSSGSEQIPLLVSPTRALRGFGFHSSDRSRFERLDGKSLNPNLSLEVGT